jgi:outer membrane protein
MKKLLVLISFVLLAGTISLNAQTNAKLGYINTQELMEIMPGIDTVKSGLETYEAQLKQTIDAMTTEFKSKYANYQQSASTMSQIIRQTKEKEINDLQSRIQQFEQTAQQEYQRKQREFLNPIIKRLKDAITKVSDANGYTYVFDVSTSILVVYEKGDNLMDKVKAELGIK